MENKEAMPVAQKVALGNIISPPNSSQEESYNQASIIKGLSSHNLLERIELRAHGYKYSVLKKEWIQSTEPLMNELGINKLMIFLEAVGDLATFSNYDKKQIPRIVDFYFTNAYTEFIVYSTEFELKEYRKKEVLNILFSFYLSALNSAKNAGHRNTIRGVLSENVMARALAGGEDTAKKKKGFWAGRFGGGKD